jgi:predicted AlkP superfamily pyrophosphatase or phosphodiesterase
MNSERKRRGIVIQAIGIFCLTWLVFLPFVKAQQTLKIERPKLVVLIVVDQMRADYLTRFQEFYKGGLKRLITGGRVFDQCYHEHAVTETAPGHAAIATGRYPGHNGIVANEWWDRSKGRIVYCVEDSEAAITDYPKLPGRSPANLLRGGIGDWLKRESPQSKVFTVAGKDRSAILLGTLRANCAYWYNKDDGKFVTSAYYTPIYPAWVDSFNVAHPADDYFVGRWERLLPKDNYTRICGPDSVFAEYDGKQTTFPHNFLPGSSEPGSKYYDELRVTPFLDQLTLRFAETMLDKEGLGKGQATDLLCVSCSAADYIGHRYGPSSHEVMDYYLRLDQYLGQFFAVLDSTVGSGKYLVALSADHGVLPLPEELKKAGKDAGRIWSDSLYPDLKKACEEAALSLSLTENMAIVANENGIILDYHEVTSKGIERGKFQAAIAEQCKKIKNVADAFTYDELSRMPLGGRPYLDKFVNNFQADRSPDVVLRFKEYWLVSDSPHGTSHGSVYDYDSHVPLIFMGPGVSPGHVAEKVATVDIASTIAEYLGIDPMQDMDGKSLIEYFQVH